MRDSINHIIFWIVISLCVSCSTSKEANSFSAKIDEGFKSRLVEQQIAKSNYFIKLPPDYEISETEGPDFWVFYISSRDSTNKSLFNAGIYFGGYPTAFPPDNDSCQIESLPGVVFDIEVKWTVYNCAKRYQIQTFATKKLEKKDWVVKVHPFGSASTFDELLKVAYIFSTLRKK